MKLEAPKQAESVKKTYAEFGIKADELKSVEGFESLTHNQKLLLAENLKQITLGRIHNEAREHYGKEVKESTFLGRIWLGMSQKYQVAKQEKISAEKMVTGGMEVHKKIIQILTLA